MRNTLAAAQQTIPDEDDEVFICHQADLENEKLERFTTQGVLFNSTITDRKEGAERKINGSYHEG